WMHRVPRALPRVDGAAAVHPRPADVGGEARVADPLRPPLPRVAARAALHPELAPAGALPVGPVEAVGLRHRRRQAGGQVVASRRGRRCRHSVASPPRITLDTGVTIGPEITMDTSASGTCAVDSPRSWRTASITSSSPCM